MNYFVTCRLDYLEVVNSPSIFRFLAYFWFPRRVPLTGVTDCRPPPSEFRVRFVGFNIFTVKSVGPRGLHRLQTYLRSFANVVPGSR